MILHCNQCSNRCCVQFELDRDETVVNAYRIVPGRAVPPRKRVCHCRNLIKLIGLSRAEVLARFADN